MACCCRSSRTNNHVVHQSYPWKTTGRPLSQDPKWDTKQCNTPSCLEGLAAGSATLMAATCCGVESQNSVDGLQTITFMTPQQIVDTRKQFPRAQRVVLKLRLLCNN